MTSCMLHICMDHFPPCFANTCIWSVVIKKFIPKLSSQWTGMDYWTTRVLDSYLMAALKCLIQGRTEAKTVP